MIKILNDLKKNDKQLFIKVQKELESYGSRSSKSWFNRHNFNDYLDLISMADSSTFIPSEYDLVMSLLSSLNPVENEFMKAVNSTEPKDYKHLRAELAKQTARTRQHVLKILKQNEKPKPTFIESLARFKQVFS